MTDLELTLRRTAETLEWPETPDIARAVRAQIAGVPRAGGVTPRQTGDTRMRGFRLGRPLAIALAALLVLAGAAAAIPGVRDPVLDFLGLRSVKVERVPRLPAHPQPRRAQFGIATTLSAARGRVDFAPVAARGLGAPRAYVDDTPPGGRVVLVYRGGRVVLTEFEGDLRTPFLQKMVGPGTRLERVRVNGARGLWISGALHEVVFLDRQGEIRPDATYLAGATLLWRRAGLLLRLEGARSRAEALRIARSVRGTP